MAEFVAVYHLAARGVGHVPAELLDHWAEHGWKPVPDDVNLRDPEAVAALFSDPPDPTPVPRRSNPTPTSKE